MVRLREIAYFFLWFGVSYAQFNIVRDTTLGKVMGYAGATVEQYLGIPFAASPLGSLRWKPPLPHPGWKDTGEIWNATAYRQFCAQPDLNSNVVNGAEDCLFLNIFVPRTPITGYFAVMVYIYGGGFFTGDSNFYDARLLASNNDVIVVTFNYRVGALGFLSTGDNQATGNYGLLDQRAALQWVQDNIKNFGGDKNRVTLFGNSAGAASVLYQVISPLNLGFPQLFHRVIAESGTPLLWWSYQSEPRHYAMKLIEQSGCPTFSIPLAMECLRNLSAEEIIALQGWMPEWIESKVDIPWLPSTDGYFLTDLPDVMVSDEDLQTALNGRYEFVIGVNEYDFEGGIDDVKEIQNEDDFSSYIVMLVKEYFSDAKKMTEAISYNYVDPAKPPTSSFEWQQLALSVNKDMKMIAGSVNMSRITSSGEGGFNSTTYMYYFIQQPGQALVDVGLAYEEDNLTCGAQHTEEVSYVFGIPLTLADADADDRDLSLEIMAYWTNFAKTGNPSSGASVTVEWPQYNWGSQEYLVLGKDKPDDDLTRVTDHLETDKVIFWTQELELYGEGKGFDDSVVIPASNETDSTIPFSPIVNTTGGRVRGLRLEQDGYITDRFLRIPFAKPPVGRLRFKYPEPHPGWEGIRDGNGNISTLEWFNGCAQISPFGNTSLGTEDCLFLNVWVPGGIEAKRDRPLPVMVWFYGGAFVWGRATGLLFYYDFQRLANQGQVIGVSVNYRLGPLGFLSTLDENAPGNAGFLDQVMGLQWVQDNIASFGGDPDKVTIFGESAGAGSVSLHMLSPLSKNLFLRGIAESGVAPAAWTMSYDPVEKAERLAKYAGCPTESTKLLVGCLQNADVGVVVKGSVFNDIGDPKDNAWAAVIDGYFVIEDPMNILHTSADKDFLLGHNSMDGHMFASVDFLRINVDNLPMSRDDIIQASTLFAPNVPDYIAEAVAFKYIDWEEPNTGLWAKLAVVGMYTDEMFVVPTYWTANERASANGTGKTFIYRFSELSGFNFLPEWMEADHTSEMEYTFGHPFGRRNFTDADRKLSLAMMTHWTNFAWTGDPNYPNQGDTYAEWPEYKLDTKYAIQFNTSIATDPSYPSLFSNYRGEYIEFWTDMLKDIWTMPIDVCPSTKGKSSTKKSTDIMPKVESRAVVSCVNKSLVRATESGCIQGYEYESNGKVVERYLGIPYMKPALGALRFLPPQPADSWTDIYNATSYSKICPQNSAFDPETMSEDCLYMCIYVPQVELTTDTQDGLPVMIWLHGGGFMYGNGMEKLKGDTIAALRNVVVINFNYRLGSLGFLTTDDEASPGNFGLLDQQFALNWVKNNIKNFGGDPSRMTIFGNSAGGQSVLLQSLSPTNKDLGITRAIMESAAIIPHDDLKQRASAVSLADAASCPTTSTNEAIVECLRNLDVADLLSAQAATGLSFQPTVDGEFLPDHPRELADRNEVRKWTYIIGCNNGDGSVRWGDIENVEDETAFYEVINKWLEPPYGWRTNLISQQTADYDDLNFFNDNQKMQLNLVQMFGDERYCTPALEVAEEYVGYGSDVYFYFFTYPYYRPDFYTFPSWAGAAHSAEFSFVFGDVINDEEQPEEVKDLSRVFIEYWTNFAKTGNPNSGYKRDPDPEVEWASYKGGSAVSVAKNYIRLDLGNLTKMEEDLRPTEKAFWLNHMYAEAEYCEVEPPEKTTQSPPPVVPEFPTVASTTGEIRGKRIKTDLYDVHAFLGIPYAKPPVADLRFAKAEKVDSWTNLGTLDATVPNPPCMQLAENGNAIGEEDCLYLDVFMPTGLVNTGTSSMPVAFWIHGDSSGLDSSPLDGSFWRGGGSPDWDKGSDFLDPSYLANFGNMVVVRPNFRLGPLGFLTTQSEAMSGNYGLSDLIEALNWAVENTGTFGGDSNKFTLVGQGSGAAAAELLAVLPSTKDHVKRVISLSGSSFAPWAFCSYQECENVARLVAERNECPDSLADTEILSCLRDLNAEDIIQSISFIPVTSEPDDISNAWGTWRFVKDGDVSPSDINVEELFMNSNIDFMTTTMSHEFYNYLTVAYPDSQSRAASNTFLQTAIEDTNEFLAYNSIEKWPMNVYKTLTHEYTNWEDRYDQELAFASAVQYYTDLMFAVHSSKSIQSLLGTGSGALYQMVVERLLLREETPTMPSWVGGRHGDDVTYAFGVPFTKSSEYSDADREFSSAFMGYLANFAWNGDPNNAFSSQNWKEFTSDSQAYLEMKDGLILPGTPTNFNIEKNNLWSNVIPMFEPVNVPVTPTTTVQKATTKSSTSKTTKPVTPQQCEVPPIAEGLGLSLTPSEADTAIYAMFSVCLILGVAIFLFLAGWICQSRAIKSKNEKTMKENGYHVNASFSNEDLKSGNFSAL